MNIRFKLTTGLLGLFLLGAGSMTGQDIVSDKTAEKAERQAMIEAYRADIKAIKDDTSLTEEQKETKIREVRQEMSKKGAKRKGYRPGQGKDGIRYEKRRAAREALKRQMQAIDENTELSEEERMAAKKQLKEDERSQLNNRKGAKIGSDAKGPKGRKALKRKHLAKLNNKMDKGLSEAETAKVVRRLDGLEKKLDKQYSKGKISEENYTKRKAEITDLRSKL
jgi:hypothetical protein